MILHRCKRASTTLEAAARVKLTDLRFRSYGLASSFSGLSTAAQNATALALSTPPSVEALHSPVSSYLALTLLPLKSLGTFLEWMVPYEKDRMQMTSANFPIAFGLVFLPLLVLGILVRRQHTTTIRRALMPFAMALIMRGNCAYRWLPVWDRRTNYQLGEAHSSLNPEPLS